MHLQGPFCRIYQPSNRPLAAYVGIDCLRRCVILRDNMAENRCMRAISSLFVFLALVRALMAQAPTPMTARYDNLPGVAIYSKGYLLSWDTQYTQFTLYGHDAKPAFSLPERIDGASSDMWAADSDGVIAAAYSLLQTQEGRIDLLVLTGRISSTLNTVSYFPLQVVFAADHTIWTASFAAANKGYQDFYVLHHYDRSGQELGKALSRSRTGADPAYPVVGRMFG